MCVRFLAPAEYFAYHHVCKCENTWHVFKMPMNGSNIYVNIRAKSENLYWIIFMKVDSKGKGKAVPLQAWTGLEGSRKLMFPDFMTGCW